MIEEIGTASSALKKQMRRRYEMNGIILELMIYNRINNGLIWPITINFKAMLLSVVHYKLKYFRY